MNAESSSPVVISTRLRKKQIDAIFFLESVKKLAFQSCANTFLMPVACVSVTDLIVLGRHQAKRVPYEATLQCRCIGRMTNLLNGIAIP